MSIAEVGNSIVNYGLSDWSHKDFLSSISLYLDRDKYDTGFIMIGGKLATYIFAKGFTPHEQIRNYLQQIDPRILKSEGVSIAQVANNVSYWQQGQSVEELQRAIHWYLQGRDGYVVRPVAVDKDKGIDTDAEEGEKRKKKQELRVFLEQRGY